jgi:DNA topoisomerase-1
VLDRFCGYMVSGPLSNVAGEKLSAGRVQSPAVRLVVEREREIQDFRSTTHYGAELTFENVDNITDGWKAAWQVSPWLESGQEYLLDKTLAEKAAALRSLEVLDLYHLQPATGLLQRSEIHAQTDHATGTKAL